MADFKDVQGVVDFAKSSGGIEEYYTAQDFYINVVKPILTVTDNDEDGVFACGVEYEGCECELNHQDEEGDSSTYEVEYNEYIEIEHSGFPEGADVSLLKSSLSKALDPAIELARRFKQGRQAGCICYVCPMVWVYVGDDEFFDRESFVYVGLLSPKVHHSFKQTDFIELTKAEVMKSVEEQISNLEMLQGLIGR